MKVGDQLDRLLAVQPPDDAQHLQLGVGWQPVPALGLARRRAAAQHLVAGAPGAAETSSSSVASRVARTVDRMPPPSGGDLGVGRAGEAAPELLAPVAAEHDVGVRIDEPRHDGAARRRRSRSRRDRAGTARSPSAAARRTRSPPSAATVASAIGPASACARAALGRAPGAGEQLPGPADDEVGDHARGSALRLPIGQIGPSSLRSWLRRA